MARARNWKLFWWTLPAVVISLLAGAFFITIWAMNLVAGSAYAKGEYQSAEDSYRKQCELSQLVPEPWKARYNEGTAQLADGQYDDSAVTLAEVLPHVPVAPVTNGLKDPESDECIVRSNLSMSYEGQADVLREAGDLQGAIALYKQAIDTIGACTSDGVSAAEQLEAPVVDPEWRPDADELRQWEKMQQTQQEQQSSDPSQSESESESESPSGGEPTTGETTSVDPRIEEIESRNAEAGRSTLPGGSGYGGGQNW